MEFRECLLSPGAESFVFQFAIPNYVIRKYNLPAVLYGYETWSLKLREERRLGGMEDMVLRGLFGPKRGEERKGG